MTFITDSFDKYNGGNGCVRCGSSCFALRVADSGAGLLRCNSCNTTERVSLPECTEDTEVAEAFGGFVGTGEFSLTGWRQLDAAQLS